MPVGEGLCPRCLEPIPLGANFCNRCSTPLTFHAATGPYESVFAEGFAYREAANNPRKPIILIGMWLLWGPGFLVSLCMFGFALVTCQEARNIFEALAMLLVTGACLWFTATLLFRTTKNYYRIRDESEPEEEAEEEIVEER
jgi:hypothetical protein